MPYTYTMRIGPTSYSQVKTLKYYIKPLNPFPLNPDTGGNCTWWAWGRFLEVMSQGKEPYNWKYGRGDACTFYKIMTAGGLQGGLVPKPGAIICWGYEGKALGDPGHVAFVEKVNTEKDGTVKSIEVSQSGYSSGPLGNLTLYPGKGKQGTESYKLGYRNSYFNGFIYNPVDFGNPAHAIASASGATDETTQQWYISKYGTGAIVYFELMKYGYSHKACCAVLGNMQQESGIRVYTGGSSDGNGSEGLCQWTFGRKTKMQTYAQSHSVAKTWKSVDGQVAYLVYELEHSETAANKVLKNDSLSLEEMTQEFEKKFERAGVPMMEKRIKYAKEWDAKMQGAAYATEGVSSVDMRQRINKLYSSENYTYLPKRQQESISVSQTLIDDYSQKLKSYISRTSFSPTTVNTGAVPEPILGSGPEKVQKEQIVRTKSQFTISEALVQTPFVEVTIGGYTVGSYRGNLDDYPNYISRLDVKKINGEINQYTIGMVYQIRPGEDPNLLDKLFSKVRYNKITIRYGDCASGALFKDTEAIITNITNNRDYASSRISYTIYATSACNYVTSIKFNFPAITDKPSNVIKDLLYNNTETSNLLLEAFPGMRNQLEVMTKNWLPTNDIVLNIEAKNNMNVIQYISYLVGCMSSTTAGVMNTATQGAKTLVEDITQGSKTLVEKSTQGAKNLVDTVTGQNLPNNDPTNPANNSTVQKNITTGIKNIVKEGISEVDNVLRNSLYYLVYEDSSDGAYFKVEEIQKLPGVSKLIRNVFEITVGYPDGNDVYDFKVNTNEAWSMLYKNNSISGEYIYDIDANGNRVMTYSPNLVNSANILNEMQKNWWTEMVNFPIKAQLTMRGLLKPITLMDYVQVNVVFYGRKHITSGLYAIVGEQDVLAGSGFLTNLSLVRVSD